MTYPAIPVDTSDRGQHRTPAPDVDDQFQPYSLPRAITNPLTWPDEIAYLYENGRASDQSKPDKEQLNDLFPKMLPT